MTTLTSRARVAAVAIALLFASGGVSAAAQCPFVPDGYFAFYGPAPRGFESVAFVALWGYNRPIGEEAPTGVYTTGAGAYAAETTGITTGPEGLGFRWNFTTSEVGRVRYGFAGAFRDVCDFADPQTARPGRVLLEGRLERVEDGLTVAAADARFVYYRALPKKLARYGPKRPRRTARRPAPADETALAGVRSIWVAPRTSRGPAAANAAERDERLARLLRAAVEEAGYRAADDEAAADATLRTTTSERVTDHPTLQSPPNEAVYEVAVVGPGGRVLWRTNISMLLDAGLEENDREAAARLAKQLGEARERSRPAGAGR
jgi:hypothetical protein